MMPLTYGDVLSSMRVWCVSVFVCAFRHAINDFRDCEYSGGVSDIAFCRYSTAGVCVIFFVPRQRHGQSAGGCVCQ